MVSKKVKIINEQGFHMRPANDFVREMAKFKSDIHLVMGEKDVNGKSIMNIMAACIKYGSEIEVRCDGEDEQAMLDKAVEMISSGLGEAPLSCHRAVPASGTAHPPYDRLIKIKGGYSLCLRERESATAAASARLL